MVRGWAALAAVIVAIGLPSAPALAEIFPVPDSVRKMAAPHEEMHVLRATDGTVLGEQRSKAVVKGDELTVDCFTKFTNGETWDERAVMNIANGYRAESCRKTAHRNGEVVSEQSVDFKSGDARWLLEGKRGAEKLTLEPDTYMGPMMGVVLAAVPNDPQRTGSFHTVVFSPDPKVYMLRADVVAQEVFRAGKLAEPTTKMRLRADLGTVQNTLFASLIPTHYFWFTRESPPEFFAFEGTLGYNGPELRMIPEKLPARTALAK